MHAAVRHQPDQVDPGSVGERRTQHLVALQRPVRDGLVYPRQVLHDYRAGAQVHVPDLGVTHLTVGEPDRSTAGDQLGMGIGGPELVEHRRVGE